MATETRLAPLRTAPFPGINDPNGRTLGDEEIALLTEVITSPITDMGTVIPILLQNCVPVFADVDPFTLCIDPADVERRITARTRVIIAYPPGRQRLRPRRYPGGDSAAGQAIARSVKLVSRRFGWQETACETAA